MECKGCAKDFSESQLKKVGKWGFCPPCFDKLLDGSSAGNAEDDRGISSGETLVDHLAAPESDEDSPPLVIQEEQARCTVCNAVLGEQGGHDMGILTVCGNCYQELISRPEPVKISEEAPDEADTADAEPDIPWQDPMETVPCTGCRRTIKKVAAKQFQDVPYCPDCFYKNNYHQY